MAQIHWLVLPLSVALLAGCSDEAADGVCAPENVVDDDEPAGAEDDGDID